MIIADIITEFGAYYLNHGQNKSRLYMMLLAKSMTDQALTTIVTDDTVWRASKVGIERVLQPFQKAFTPVGQATFTPVAIEQFKQKIDSQEYPDDLESSWLGFLADSNLDRKTWPFVRWFVESLLIPQAKEDYELNAIYYGKYKAPTAGTAGEAFEVMNGLRLAINSAVLAGRITTINTGAFDIDDAKFVTQIEDFVDSINTKYWSVPMMLCMSETNERRFSRGYRAKYGKDTNFADNKGKVDFSNVTIIGLPSHNGSDKIWATPKNNVIRLMKKSQNMDSVQIENVDRLVKMYSDWFSGAGFIIPEIVFTNDLDLGAPSIKTLSSLVSGTAGGGTFTVEGMDFTGASGATAVKVGVTNVTSYVIVNDRKLTFVMPAKTAGPYKVSVTTPYGTGLSTQDIVVS